MNLCQRAEHSAERLLREMSPILWLPGGGNMGIVDIHYGQLHWTRHSQAQSTSHVSRALQVSLINSLLSKLCFQMTFMGLIVILKNWLPKLWRHTPESIQEKNGRDFYPVSWHMLFLMSCWRLDTARERKDLPLKDQKWTFIQGFKSCPASLNREEKLQLQEMCHVWDRLPSILTFLFDVAFVVFFGASRNAESFASFSMWCDLHTADLVTSL